MPQTEINREHKDRLFRLLFGGSYSRQNLLDLYNALNDTNYNDLEELQVTTIEDVIYMGMKNDVSILLHSRMALYEHQSTYNPNMPVRGFLYAAKLYEKYIESNELNIYGSTQVELPVPQYVVFYNGSGQHEDEEILRLSDAFERKEDGEGYEWTARMLNINYGKNKKLMERCKALRDYSIFTDKVKKYLKQEMNTKQAINRAVEECIKEDVMSEFLIARRAEVVDVCITEYNEERVMSSIREEGIREGIREGEKKAIKKMVINSYRKGNAPESIAEFMDISLEQVKKILEHFNEYQ